MNLATIYTGGLANADLASEDALAQENAMAKGEAKKSKGRTYRDNVIIEPSQNVTKPKVMDIWVPGPQTATLYAKWLEKNGGKVTLNNSVAIQRSIAEQKK